VAHPRPLTGDVADAAAEVLEAALALAPGQALAFGGETTVTLRGHGLGGRNQELALRVALAAAGRGLSGDWAFLAGGSDGRDGPTEAAGGLVDAGTAGRIAAAGLDPAALLADNDSNRALAAAGDLVVTGATGTNVADLAVFVRAGT
jgi:hydroxypyruvate reductase